MSTKDDAKEGLMWKRIWWVLCFIPRLLLESIRTERKVEAAHKEMDKGFKNRSKTAHQEGNETELNGGVDMEAVLRPRKNTTREIRRLWRDEAVLELLGDLGGRALSTNMNRAAQRFSWRFRVRTHLRRLESYGLVKSGIARGSGGSEIINWRITEGVA